MPAGADAWWAEDRVNGTVTPAYIHSHLRATEQELLQRSLYFGGDVTNDTYLDRIVRNSKRLFLILVATGVPDQIFGIIDDSFEDDNLPIAEEIVPSLRLSIEPDAALNKRFYRAQFKYLARILQEGEHIRYAGEETVPIIGAGLKSAVSLNKEGGDVVRLPGSDSLFISRKIKITASVTERQVLREVAELKKFSHEHTLSIFASYMQNDSVHILSTPAGEYTLKTFLTDQPRAFDALTKPDRRKRLMNWTHCLANALAWLHANGGHHGAMRPSNIHITPTFDICLGSMDGDGTLCIASKSDDIETYQYAPPERWKRAVTVQTTGPGKLSLPSGNRTGRKVQHDLDSPNDPSTRRPPSSLDVRSDREELYAFHPASKSEFGRLRLTYGTTPGSHTGSRAGRLPLTSNSVDSYGIRSTRPALPGGSHRSPSAISSNSSEGRRRAQSDTQHGLFVSAPESRTAVVQTWKSVQHDSFAADVFSLGAVILDILTVLCKRTFSAFTRHRSKNNRNAGRGGGLADASFHANLSQVVSWAQLLANDAEKKVKSDDSRVLSAVGAVLQVAVQCLERSPELRPKSKDLERKLKDHITRFAGIDPLHCFSPMPESSRSSEARAQLSVENLLNRSVTGRADRFPSRTQRSRTTISEDESSTIELPSPHSSTTNRGPRNRIEPRANSPPTVSLDSFSALNIDPDSESLFSATMVANSRDQSHYSPRSDRSKDSHRPIRVLRSRWPLYDDTDLYEVNESFEADLESHNLAAAKRQIQHNASAYTNYYSNSPSDTEHEPIAHRAHRAHHGENPQQALPAPRKRLPPIPPELQHPARLDSRPMDQRREPRSRHERQKQMLDRPFTTVPIWSDQASGR